MSSTNFWLILIFASCVVGTCKSILIWVSFFIGREILFGGGENMYNNSLYVLSFSTLTVVIEVLHLYFMWGILS